MPGDVGDRRGLLEVFAPEGPVAQGPGAPWPVRRCRNWPSSKWLRKARPVSSEEARGEDCPLLVRALDQPELLPGGAEKMVHLEPLLGVGEGCRHDASDPGGAQGAVGVLAGGEGEVGRQGRGEQAHEGVAEQDREAGLGHEVASAARRAFAPAGEQVAREGQAQQGAARGGPRGQARRDEGGGQPRFTPSGPIASLPAKIEKGTPRSCSAPRGARYPLDSGRGSCYP